MDAINRRLWMHCAAAIGLAASLPTLAWAQASTPSARNRIVFQVTDNDPARWNMVLNNMQNLRDGVGSEGADIELVAYGPGILMLKADSPVKQRVQDAVKSGITVSACQNTMHGMKLVAADMQPAVSYVPSGVVEVMHKQQQGWAYIRP